MLKKAILVKFYEKEVFNLIFLENVLLHIFHVKVD